MDLGGNANYSVQRAPGCGVRASGGTSNNVGGGGRGVGSLGCWFPPPPLPPLMGKLFCLHGGAHWVWGSIHAAQGEDLMNFLAVITTSVL